MKFFKLALMLAISSNAVADESQDDWRKTGSDKEKLDNVVRVIPGASNLMLQMGERYKNLYWAGKQGKWEFAKYQVEEMEELIKTLLITRPKRAATARDFLKSGFIKFEKAFETKDTGAFFGAFEHMRQECMTCHRRNDHAFVKLPGKPGRGQSPVLDSK